MSDNWDSEYDEPDEFEDSDHDDLTDDEQTTELIACPHCGRDVYEEAQQCPYCGDYIVIGTHPFAGRPWWWIALGLLGVAAVVIWLIY